jgi:hypothetical protein
MGPRAKKVSIAAFLIGAVALAAELWWSSYGRLSLCLMDAEQIREPYEQASLRLAQDMVRGNPDAVYSQGTAELKRVMTPVQVAAVHQAYGQVMATLGPLRVAHSYFLRSLAGANNNSNGTGLCWVGLGAPEGKVSVAIKSGVKQAYVVVEGDIDRSTWGFVFSLMYEAKAWRMQNLHFGPMVVSGRTAVDYRTWAREQRDGGHIFNAVILYAAASNLAFRGPSLRLGISSEIENEAKNLRLPPELQGPAPFVWQFGTDSFRVRKVEPFFAGGETDLSIQVEVAALTDDKLTDERNRILIRHITNAYPEIFDSFEAIIVEAVQYDNPRSYRTVEYGHKAPRNASSSGR